MHTCARWMHRRLIELFVQRSAESRTFFSTSELPASCYNEELVGLINLQEMTGDIAKYDKPSK